MLDGARRPHRAAKCLLPAILLVGAALSVACGDDASADPADPAARTGSESGSTNVEGRVTGTGASGLRIREKPTTSSAQIGELAEGMVVSIACQVEGESVGGNKTWDYLQDKGGYVADAYVQIASTTPVKRCDAPNAPPPPPTGATVDIEGPTVRPHVQLFANDACRIVAACKASTYEGHEPSADLALDFLASEEFGQHPKDNYAFGDRLAAFAVEHRAQYRIDYVIYRQRINLGDGWEPMEDRGGVTQNHFDHVHVSFDP